MKGLFREAPDWAGQPHPHPATAHSESPARSQEGMSPQGPLAALRLRGPPAPLPTPPWSVHPVPSLQVPGCRSAGRNERSETTTRAAWERNLPVVNLKTTPPLTHSHVRAAQQHLTPRAVPVVMKLPLKGQGLSGLRASHWGRGGGRLRSPPPPRVANE